MSNKSTYDVLVQQSVRSGRTRDAVVEFDDDRLPPREHRWRAVAYEDEEFAPIHNAVDVAEWAIERVPSGC
jgi:hypothetical protein